MRKVTFLCVCFFFHLSWGQEYLDGYDIKTNQQRLENSYLFIIERLKTHIFFDDGHCYSYLNVLAKSKGIQEKNTYTENFSNSVVKDCSWWCINADWYVDNKISSFHFVMKKDIEYVKANYDIGEKSEWGNCGSGMETRGYWSIPIFISPIEPCKTKAIPHFFSGGSRELELKVDASYKILPIHYLESKNPNGTDNTYLPVGDKIKLSAKNDFPSSWYYFQYTTDIVNGKYINWKDISSDFTIEKDKNRLSISISAEDVFNGKVNALENAGKKVYFRIVTKNGNENCASSNIVSLDVGQSGPKIENFIAVDPKCFAGTGNLEVEFDRNLLPNEYFRVSLVDKISKVPFISYDYSETKAMLENEKKLVFKSIPVGEYVFQTIGSIEHSKQVGDKSFLTEYLPTYSDGDNYDKIFAIKSPLPLTARFTPKNNVCYGESEGSIKVSVSGGTPPYKYTIDGKTVDITGSEFTLTGLLARDYTIGILDSHNCRREDTTITITEPVAPITIVNEKEEEEKSNEEPNPSFFKKDVSGFGLKNGEIQAILTGGTPFDAPSEPYRFTLTTKSGVVVSTSSTQTNVQGFAVHYSQLDKGDYILTITDKNNCVLTKTIFIDEPDPLVVSISEKTAISCNPANEDPNNDPKLNKDGELYAYVKGGRPPYEYQWYRVEAGNAEMLLGETASVLKQLTEGVYRVDIKDKKNNTTSGSFTLKFPERLTLTIESGEIRCSAPTSGTAKALPQGGTPPYIYQWSDGQTTQTATGLSVGKYFVVVSDRKGCSVQSQVVLSYPEAARIDSEEITQLTCYGDDNGSIVLTTSGGKGTVTHTWYDASGRMLTKGVSKDGKSVKNLVAGTYKIVLRDEGDCPPIEKIFEITQPEKLQLRLSTEVTLCQGDSHTFELDGQISGATYRWTDASGNLLGTEASLVVHSAGDYYVEATSPEGCKALGKTTVKQSSQVLEVDFLVATTSYYDYTLKLINLSKKADALQWQFSDDVIVINQNRQEAEVRFPKEGIYRVGLKGTLGECQKVIEKQLFVEKDRVGISKGIQVQKNIESFLIVPNPNSGSYQLHIKLNKASTIRVRLIDMLGRELFAPEEFSEQTDFILPFNKPTLSAGQYIILIEAAGDVLSQKMIVK
ncbi:T9SS type A sorting domain-containing protein [Capnocytophaga canimorsus]|uniref:Ig-like domain-containing protein n=1 Tax=Capnocytophaga canimorsus TaxID=28188 RepID=A0AAC9Z3D8_9FLAO|nr:T9SS type A sorting domain-containing protein [Capnocytophaga canimorsus]ATA93823.1 hypothetical protein CGC54_05450 [Capnocytophaga canimorsus]